MTSSASDRLISVADGPSFFQNFFQCSDTNEEEYDIHPALAVSPDLDAMVTEYLTIAQHPSDEHDISFDTDHPSLEQVCASVQEILTQITRLDCPPIMTIEPGQTVCQDVQQQQHPPHFNSARKHLSNADPGATHASVGIASASTTVDNADSHSEAIMTGQSSPTDIGGVSSCDTEGSSAFGVSTFFLDYVVPNEDSESSCAGDGAAMLPQLSKSCTRMGHAALVQLCLWTLEQIQGVTPTLTTPVWQKQCASTQGTPLMLSPKANSLTAKTSTKKSRIGRFWKKGEEKKEEASTPCSFAGPQINPAPRLHMCASEYARYLSGSRLAPPPCRNKTARRNFRKSLIGRSKSGAPSPSNLTNQSFCLEDADPSTLTGAVLDLNITFGDAPPPPGYFRITQTASGIPIPLNRRRQVHINIKKEPKWDKAAQRPTITAITLMFPDRQEFVPPGFCVAKTVDTKEPANLMDSDHSDRCYLVFRRSREGNPITGVMALVPPESVPPGYTVVERTPRNHVANLNMGISKAPPLFLAYRQRLANLEALRPMPLLKTITPEEASAVKCHSRQKKAAGADFCDSEDDDDYDDSVLVVPVPKLMAYYATGGTTVSSDVGRFHLLDRSTHSLLSPSSVANRLQLIEMSRRKDIEQATTTTAGTAQEACSTEGLDPSFCDNDSYSRREGYHDFNSTPRGGEIPSVIVSNFMLPSPGMNSNTTTPRAGISEARKLVGHKSEVSPQKQAFEALSFIPKVKAARTGEEKFRAIKQLQSRSAAITPLLTACYNVHGQSAHKAVEGLFKILKQTTFFDDDVDFSDETDHQSSTRITLLDLTIQAVCDVATTSAMETTFIACVEYVEEAVRFSQGQLNTRTVGYILRFYLFIFYFGASTPCAQAAPWPNPSWRTKKIDPDEDLDFLYDPREEGQTTYLPASQTAVLAFRELISLCIVRLGKVAVNDLVFLTTDSLDQQSSLSDGTAVPRDDFGSFFDGILTEVMDNAVDHVERANYTQLAFYQVHRSGGSELFWHDMVTVCGVGLFGKDETLCEGGRDMYIMIFSLMANLVKVASGKLRARNDRSSLVNRDIGSKLLSFELLLHFLEYWSDEQEAVGAIEAGERSKSETKSVHTLAFAIRRMVVPALLSNTRCGLEDAQIFRRMLLILSELWCSPVYRKHCKIELGILIEHFVLKMLQLGPQLVALNRVDLWSDKAHISMLIHQVEVIKEIRNWFCDNPKGVIEMFLNFDTDLCSEITGPIQLLPGTKWKIFQRLCLGLSNIAEQCGELIGEQIKQNQSKIMTKSETVGEGLAAMIENMNSNLSHNTVNKTAARESAKLLRKTSLETISEIVKALAISAAASAGPKFTNLLLQWTGLDMNNSGFGTTADKPDMEVSGRTSKTSNDDTRSDRHVGKLKGEQGVKDVGVVKYWSDVIAAEQQDRLSNAVVTYEDSLFVALEIASRKSLKKAIEYLIACNSLSPAPRDIASFLRINKDSLDPVDLGNYLSESGTGGAESEYWATIRHLYVRAISFVGMHVEEGLRHFLTNCGFHLPGEAQRIDRIINSFAKCFFQDNAGDALRCPFKEEDSVYLLSFAVIMLNTDLHKSSHSHRRARKMTKAEFIGNLRGVDRGGDITRDYLSAVYDSIESRPIAMNNDSSSESPYEERTRTLHDMLNNVRSADTLLRGLAVHDFHFATIEDFISGLDYDVNDALGDLTRTCFSKTWHQWHGVIATGLETAHLDPNGMEPNIEILLYALTLTVCLDMPTERAAFLSQLSRLKTFEERRQGRWVAPDQNTHTEEDWYIELEEACSGSSADKLWALQKIHDWMTSLKKALEVDVANKVSMQEAVKQIKDGDFLLHDPARSYLKCADLVKKSKSTGRSTTYRFYLFSDVLLYASQETDGKFKIHEEFPLHLMKIIDWFPPSFKNRKLMFEVHHPRKSFYVVCDSAKERKSWVEDIKAAVSVELDRKMKVEAARLAVYIRK